MAGRWIRQDKEPNSDNLINSSYCPKDTKVGILSPEDNLLQVCIHTAKHSYVRAPGLRLHLDVERIVKHKTINWDLFLEKVVQAHVKTSTYYSLYIPNKLFGTPIPKYVLERLEPSKYKRKKIEKILKNVGLLYPHEKKFTKIQFINFQISLYDNIGDMFKVLYPGTNWFKEKYNFNTNFLIPVFFIIRLLDLVGIRKKKNQ